MLAVPQGFPAALDDAALERMYAYLGPSGLAHAFFSEGELQYSFSNLLDYERSTATHYEDTPIRMEPVRSSPAGAAHASHHAGGGDASG